MVINKSNLHSIFVFSLILSLIVGKYMVIGHVGGIEISAYRFILPFIVGYLVYSKQFVFYTNRFTKFVFYFFIVWLVYGALSLLWTPELIYGVKELFYIVIGTLTYFVFLSISVIEKNFIRIIENSLIFSFLVVLVFFEYEMITQNHLDGEYTAKLMNLGDFHILNSLPVFTFENPNVAAIYLCICFVFSAWCFLSKRNKLIHIMIIMIAFDFLFLTQSRFGVLSAVGVLFVGFGLLIFRKIRSKIIWSFSKLEVISISILIAVNCIVLYSEFSFLNTEASMLTEDTTYCKSCFKVSRALWKSKSEDERIILRNDSNSKEKSDSLNEKDDKVLVIENNVYYKLLKNKTVSLQLKEVNKDLQNDLFMGNSNFLMLASVSFLILLCIVFFILNYKFTGVERFIFLPLAFIFIAVFFCFNSYNYPPTGYKKRVLVEQGFDVEQLKKQNLSLVSVDFKTGKLFQTGQTVQTKLFIEKQDILDPNVQNAKLGSNTIRKNLALNGLFYLRESHFMGIGAGGFLASNMKKLNKYPDGGVGGAHSFIIEILSQYGVIIFSLLIGIFLWIVTKLIRGFIDGLWDEKYFLVLWLLIVLTLMGNANSSFLSLPINWLMVTFLLVFVKDITGEKEERNEISN